MFFTLPFMHSSVLQLPCSTQERIRQIVCQNGDLLVHVVQAMNKELEI